jgi:DNA-binding CsgD family transcriptional regulator
MKLHYRQMEAADVSECVEIVAQHPVIGPRYRDTIKNLHAAWSRVIGSEWGKAVVFQPDCRRSPICFVGVSAFVTDDFVRELKAPRCFWTGPELASRVLNGNSPILSGKQLRHENSTGGMNLLVWEGCVRQGLEKENQIHRCVMRAFIEEHMGYRWKEIIGSEVESVERLHWMIETGGLLWSAKARRYARSVKEDAEKIVSRPHLIGYTRELELKQVRAWSGSWVGGLFDYEAPKLGFSTAEQRLLVSAMSGRTDEKISEHLGISRATVKNRWNSVYNRAELLLPGFQADPATLRKPKQERGRERRRHLLSYLREHVEELRPISRKHLRAF